ncbi:MAG TPA: gamma-glutamyltransferase [Steroidobacteraceae bacterium]|nr:gamma-glutamyltransferase [Steroidobacteraceae bacterium]
MTMEGGYAGPRPSGSLVPTRSEVIATQGMAATSHPLASQVALDVLKRGGTAVDAAIAANATIGLMEPTGNGIGGDLFAIVWDAKTNRLYGLNASGRSPKSLTLEKLRAELKKLNSTTIPRTGPLPVSVPGTVDGWFELHGKFGKLPMKEVLAPAIFYARSGFPVTEVIAEGWERNARNLQKFPGFSETYMPKGRAPAKGDVFRNPFLANTLTAIAEGGRDAFYKGDIAKRIDAYMRANGGYLTAADLAEHRSEWVEPVSTNYRGYDVWELPPNTQGVAALQMLNILEAYDLKSMGFGSADYLHVFVEAKKLAFEDRAKYYADPEFARIPLKSLLSKDYAAKQRALIKPERAGLEYPAAPKPVDEGDTIYLTVADSAGNMVSLIQSNYRGMGSGMTPTRCGFILQDRGELFSLEDGHASVYAPGKRPFHTIIPAFVTRDGKPWLSFGLMGGAMQPQGHVQIIVNLIDFGMNLQEAGDAPRARHDGSSEPTGEVMKDGGEVVLEVGVTPATVKALEARGHKVTVANDGDFGGYQAIMRNAEGVYFGASESRKDGAAQGY